MKRLFLLICSLFLYLLAASSQEEITMQYEDGVYKIPCSVNGLKLKFIFDTGASNITISEPIANMMLENEYLSTDDIVGSTSSQVADGRIIQNTRILLKTVQVGSITIKNVEATVVHTQKAPLLLGQSAIKKLGSYTISGNKLVLNLAKINETKIESISIFNGGKEDYPLDASVLDSRAALYVALQQYNEAYEIYNQLNDDVGILSTSLVNFAAATYNSTSLDDGILILKLCLQNQYYPRDNDNRRTLFEYLVRYYREKEQYKDAIPYCRKLINLYTFTDKMWLSEIFELAYLYNKMDKRINAYCFLQDCVQEYVSFLNIKVTDCWTKDYKDKTMGELLRWIALYDESDKYFFISAAWGNSDAIEYCKKNNLDYSKKPYQYEY